MNFDMKIDSTGQLISVTVTSKLNQDMRKEILTAVAEQLAAQNYSRCVIDLTESPFEPDDSEIDAAALVEFMASIGFTPAMKLALVYADGEGQRRRWESTAQSEGFNIRYFKSLNDAVTWLNS